MARKPDGVIEAVRYKNGQIMVVRAYERRGATYSDWGLIERKALLERLQKGEKFAVGAREPLRASTFKLAHELILVKQDEHQWIATRSNATRDELEGTPVF